MAIVHLLMNFKRKELMTKQEVIQSIIDVQDAIGMLSRINKMIAEIK